MATAFAAELLRPEDDMAGLSPPTRALRRMIARLAPRDVTVLVHGPTGAGKEVAAQLLHRLSSRSARPFVAVNCAAIPDTMLEATLFGHERGAFTGATQASPGLLRAAEGGTLLLDEIAELGLPLQAKLLRVLQERTVTPLGGSRAVAVDVRIIAATHRHLAARVREGQFREDLYYRLNVCDLGVPPLSERPDDLLPLCAALLLRARHDSHCHWLAPCAIERLQQHDWPGNVRELGNCLLRASVLADSPLLMRDDIRIDGLARDDSAAAEHSHDSLDASVRQHEHGHILETLRACDGHRGATARRLGISERTLRYKLAEIAGRPRTPAAVQR